MMNLCREFAFDEFVISLGRIVFEVESTDFRPGKPLASAVL